jgi:hypothetical protein
MRRDLSSKHMAQAGLPPATPVFSAAASQGDQHATERSIRQNLAASRCLAAHRHLQDDHLSKDKRWDVSSHGPAQQALQWLAGIRHQPMDSQPIFFWPLRSRDRYRVMPSFYFYAIAAVSTTTVKLPLHSVQKRY